MLPGTTRDQWIADVKRRLGDPSLKIELINESDDPLVTPQDTPLYRQLEAAIKRRHADAIVTPILIPYGTDSNAFRPRGVKSYGIFPAAIPADVASSMHGDTEHVPLAAVVEASQVLFEAVRDTMAKPLANGDNRLALARARFNEAKLQYHQLVKAKAEGGKQ